MEVVIRVLVVYVFVLFGLRMLGKRELSQLSAIELVTLMLVPEIVSQAIAGESSMTNALIGVSTLFTLVFLTSLLSYLSKSASNIIEGKPLVLKDRHGLQVEVMDRERITIDEIYAELRKKGHLDLSNIEMLVLEADGKISMIEKQPENKQQDDDGDKL